MEARCGHQQIAAATRLSKGAVTNYLTRARLLVSQSRTETEG
jgi:hypothetical protein